MNLENSGNGDLKVRVTTGNGAIPIEGAVVHIRPYNVINQLGESFTLRTDQSGNTETISLFAPPATLSKDPSNRELPYSEYVMTVIKDGFRTAENIALPVFDGIVSVQTVNLIPLTEYEFNSGDNETIYYENTGYTSLRGITTNNDETGGIDNE